MENNRVKISNLECIKVLFVTFMAILVPSLIIGGIITWLTPLSMVISTTIGVLCTIAIIFLLGFHKPATTNDFVDDEDEDDD